MYTDAPKPWEDLANAVILQAIEDYNTQIRILRMFPEDHMAKKIIKDVDTFIDSDYFGILTKCDRSVIRQALLAK